MNNQEIIKKVLENLGNYEVSIHYSANHSNNRLEFSDNSEEYGGSFKIENIMDFDILIFNNDHQISLDYVQCEKIIQFLISQENIRNFLNEIKSYDAIKKYFKNYDELKTNNQIDEKYILIINDNVIQNIVHSDSKVVFYCGDNQRIYSYHLLQDFKHRKWFHKDGDDILIFNKESSLF